MKKYYIAITFLLVAGLAIAVSHFFVGRDAVSDALRVEDIQKLESTVQKYADDNKKLPDSIKDLQPDATLKYHDYTYQKNSDSDFSICATFKNNAHPAYYASSNDPASHKAGHQCFSNTASNLVRSTYQPAPAPQSRAVCGYPHKDDNEKAVSTIKTIDVANFRLTVDTGSGLTQTYYWAGPAYAPYVFDANCKQITIQDVHVGQKVILYGTIENILHYIKLAS